MVSRPGYGRKPWCLITTEPVHTPEQAWQVVFAYTRCWQIEMCLRFTKSEMAFESPRLFHRESCLKFLLIASLAYAFLLSMLTNLDFLFHFISRYCHRTGKWSLKVKAPLYRLHLALSCLWLEARPHSLLILISGWAMLSDIVREMLGKEEENYKRIQRFLASNSPQQALLRLFNRPYW